MDQLSALSGRLESVVCQLSSLNEERTQMEGVNREVSAPKGAIVTGRAPGKVCHRNGAPPSASLLACLSLHVHVQELWNTPFPVRARIVTPEL